MLMKANLALPPQRGCMVKSGAVNLHALLADLILLLHALFIAFVVLGMLAIALGAALRRQWVRNFYFRAAHLAAIGYVVVQALFGMVCPLTDLENALRVRAGQEPYDAGGFIQTWLHRLIFFDAEPWVFTLCYTLFGLLVAAVMWWVPPRRPPWLDRWMSRRRGEALSSR